MLLNDNQRMIADLVTKISKEKIAPQAAEIDRKKSFPRKGLQNLAEADLLGITVPEDMGGTAADITSYVLAAEAIAEGCASTALLYVTHTVVARAIALAADDETKKTLLPAMISGARLGAFALTEPNSGANPIAISTNAKSDGDNFIVNGNKIFITGAEEAEIYIVILKTDSAKTPVDLTCLIIEKGTPGFSFSKKGETLGMRGVSDGELIFQNCIVPKSNLIGEENGYLAVMPKFAGYAMLGTAGIALGIAKSALHASIEHAKSRVILGNPIGLYQGIQYLIAEMNTDLEAARSLTFSAAASVSGPPPISPVPLYMAKLHSTQMAISVTDKAIQVHGGNGYSCELPLERYYRDARCLTLHFTPTEMLKGMLGRMIMGMSPM